MPWLNTPPRMDIHGVTIPYTGDWRDFTTPEWDKILGQYGSWAQRARYHHVPHLNVVQFIASIANLLETWGIRERTAINWIERMVQHHDATWLGMWMQRYGLDPEEVRLADV